MTAEDRVAELVGQVVELLASRPATLGSGRLLCIDGPAGSGKTTLAAAVAARTSAPVLRMDDLYPGWSGLFTVDATVLGVLEPLSRARPGRYRRYDWHAEQYAEEHQVDPAPLLILEGVGAAHRAWASWTTASVWVETDDVTRLARGLARDGAEFREHWHRWMRDEAQHFATDGTRDRADLVLST